MRRLGIGAWLGLYLQHLFESRGADVSPLQEERQIPR